MSQLHDLYVANESDAQLICDDPGDRSDEISVSAFDESKQLSLLSIFRKIPQFPEVPEIHSHGFYAIYHKYFKLLYPSEAGSEAYVAKFPDDFVLALAELSDDAIADLAASWLAIEPSFAKCKWTEQDVEDLLKKVCSTCQTATTERKHVLFRFSL
jgi:hypothetical protein